ncbi:MAG: hypothetical protein GXP43_00610, partial [bacterium]|nr:hypothetical protein [bacterium]
EREVGKRQVPYQVAICQRTTILSEDPPTANHLGRKFFPQGRADNTETTVYAYVTEHTSPVDDQRETDSTLPIRTYRIAGPAAIDPSTQTPYVKEIHTLEILEGDQLETVISRRGDQITITHFSPKSQLPETQETWLIETNEQGTFLVPQERIVVKITNNQGTPVCYTVTREAPTIDAHGLPSWIPISVVSTTVNQEGTPLSRTVATLTEDPSQYKKRGHPSPEDQPQSTRWQWIATSTLYQGGEESSLTPAQALDFTITGEPPCTTPDNHSTQQALRPMKSITITFSPTGEPEAIAFIRIIKYLPNGDIEQQIDRFLAGIPLDLSLTSPGVIETIIQRFQETYPRRPYLTITHSPNGMITLRDHSRGTVTTHHPKAPEPDRKLTKAAACELLSELLPSAHFLGAF